MKKQTTKTKRETVTTTKPLTTEQLEHVVGGATINSGGVNPTVISRDRG